MFNGFVRFWMDADVRLDEVELTLQLATFAAEGLFGIPRVAMEFQGEGAFRLENITTAPIAS